MTNFKELRVLEISAIFYDYYECDILLCSVKEIVTIKKEKFNQKFKKTLNVIKICVWSRQNT